MAQLLLIGPGLRVYFQNCAHVWLNFPLDCKQVYRQNSIRDGYSNFTFYLKQLSLYPFGLCLLHHYGCKREINGCNYGTAPSQTLIYGVILGVLCPTPLKTPFRSALCNKESFSRFSKRRRLYLFLSNGPKAFPN